MNTTPRTNMARTHRPAIQLSLLPRAGWQLDQRTREIGRQGVATAREALRHARSQPRAAAADRSPRQAA